MTLILERVRGTLRDPVLAEETMRSAELARQDRLPEIHDKLLNLNQRRRQMVGDRANLLDAIESGAGNGRDSLLERLGVVDEKLAGIDSEAAVLRQEAKVIETAPLDEEDLRAALADFDPLWEHLEPKERRRVLRLLLESVTYHGAEEEVRLAFWPTGVQQLADERLVTT